MSKLVQGLDTEGIYGKLEPMLPIAVAAAPESTTIDVLVAVPNHRQFTPLVQHLSAGSANVVRVGGVLASVADGNWVVMHRANQSGTLCTLHPVGLGTRRRLGGGSLVGENPCAMPLSYESFSVSTLSRSTAICLSKLFVIFLISSRMFPL